MTNNHHKLLVLFYTGITDEKELGVEMNHLTNILRSTESPDIFCAANELVNRNSITNNRKRMIKEARYRRLRPFRFFINKN